MSRDGSTETASSSRRGPIRRTRRPPSGGRRTSRGRSTRRSFPARTTTCSARIWRGPRGPRWNACGSRRTTGGEPVAYPAYGPGDAPPKPGEPGHAIRRTRRFVVVGCRAGDERPAVGPAEGAREDGGSGAHLLEDLAALGDAEGA